MFVAHFVHVAVSSSANLCGASQSNAGVLQPPSWYKSELLKHNLPCNLPCTASLANHPPARPRAQWTYP